MADLTRLIEIVEPEVKAEGLALVRVKMLGGTSDPTLQVMAERPDTRQISLGECEALSRRISEAIDAAEEKGETLIDGGYRLEVSSPGIDRPLTRLQDFEDWKGHRARINVIEPVLNRKQFTGTLVGVDRELIGLDTPKLDTIWMTLPNIHSAKLVLTDELIAATAPLSTEGADRIEEDRRGSATGRDDSSRTEGQV